jgi:hypothetical protein
LVPDVAIAGRKHEKEIAPIVRAYYGLFGLKPVSRSRVATPATPTPVSRWSGLACSGRA